MTNDELLADLEVGESVEVAPGVTVERRCFLQTAALGAAALVLPDTGRSAGTASTASTAGDRLSYEEFLAAVNSEVEKRVAAIPKTGEDHYLYWLASHAVRLADVAKPEKVKEFSHELSRANFFLVSPGPKIIIVSPSLRDEAIAF